MVFLLLFSACFFLAHFFFSAHWDGGKQDQDNFDDNADDDLDDDDGDGGDDVGESGRDYTCLLLYSYTKASTLMLVLLLTLS